MRDGVRDMVLRQSKVHFPKCAEGEDLMSDPLAAREKTDAALEQLRNTAWPKDSDYRDSGLS